MRATWAMTLIMAICCAGTAFAAEPSGAEVIDKFIEASGGKDKMAAAKNRTDTGTLTLIDLGMESAYTNTVAPPNSLMSMDFQGSIVQNGLTDGVAWSVNPFQGNSKTETQAKANIFPSLDLAMAGEMAKNVGEEDVEGAACYKVELPSPEGGTANFWFDKESGLMTKTVDAGGQTTLLSDYKEVDGLNVPHKIVQSGGEFNIEIVLTKVEFDTDIEDSTFEIPAEVGE